MQVQSLGWEDPLEVGMATQSSILAWRIPWTEEPDGLQPIGLQRVRHDWSYWARARARAHTHTHTHESYYSCNYWPMGFPGGSDGKGSACNAGDLGLIPGLGRSPGEGNGYPLLYSCLENPMDSGIWWLLSMGSKTEWLTHTNCWHCTDSQT